MNQNHNPNPNPNPNGRVDTMHNTNLTSYDFFKESKTNQDHFQINAVRHIHSDSEVGSLFFSQHNLDILQNGIRYSIHRKTNNKHTIGNQSETELQVIMRSIYLQYSRNLKTDIVKQVKELNSRVLDYAVPKILSELNQYVNYTHDITYLPVPLERSQNMSTTGTKILYRNEL